MILLKFSVLEWSVRSFHLSVTCLSTPRRVLQRKILNPIIKSFRGCSKLIPVYAFDCCLNNLGAVTRTKWKLLPISLSKPFKIVLLKLPRRTSRTQLLLRVHYISFYLIIHRLTDETIRENLEKYGHPDGRQDVSMGIALPQWIVERKNNIWVLGIYGLLFGGALPALVVCITSFCPS